MNIVGAAVAGELTSKPIRGVVREATILSQGTEAEGVSDSEEAGQAVVSVAPVEKEEIDADLP
ncbi:hypothetical protein [Streptomyces xanthophaeus]